MKVVRSDLSWALVSKVRSYYLPASSSMESLHDLFGPMRVITARYDNHVLVVGDRYDGFVSAVYEFLEDGMDIDSRLGLIWMDNRLHDDAGHALEAALAWSRAH